METLGRSVTVEWRASAGVPGSYLKTFLAFGLVKAGGLFVYSQKGLLGSHKDVRSTQGRTVNDPLQGSQ